MTVVKTINLGRIRPVHRGTRGQNGTESITVSDISYKADLVGTSDGRNVTGGYDNGGNWNNNTQNGVRAKTTLR